MGDFWVIFISCFIMFTIMDYAYVGIGDVFVDKYGNRYTVVNKNILFARLEGDADSIVLSNIRLCSTFIKVSDGAGGSES